MTDIVAEICLGGRPIRGKLVEDAFMLTKTEENSRIPTIPDYSIHIPEVIEMTVQENDVFTCGFPKSGTNWLWEITAMLLNGSAKYQTNEKAKYMLDFMSVESLLAHPHPAVFSTHLTPRCMPKQLFQKRCKIVFIQRNPKDVQTSFFPFLKAHRFLEETLSFEEYIMNVMKLDTKASLLNWFYYTKTWFDFLNSSPDLTYVHCMMFEDLKENPEKEIRKLADFLGVSKDEGLVKEIAQNCDFENLKKAAASRNQVAKGRHEILYRKGNVGDWKNYFTVAMNEQFDLVYNERMKGIDFKYKYTL